LASAGEDGDGRGGAVGTDDGDAFVPLFWIVSWSPRGFERCGGNESCNTVGCKAGSNDAVTFSLHHTLHDLASHVYFKSSCPI
jgi:hypothetical protein